MDHGLVKFARRWHDSHVQEEGCAEAGWAASLTLGRGRERGQSHLQEEGCAEAEGRGASHRKSSIVSNSSITGNNVPVIV